MLLMRHVATVIIVLTKSGCNQIIPNERSKSEKAIAAKRIDTPLCFSSNYLHISIVPIHTRISPFCISELKGGKGFQLPLNVRGSELIAKTGTNRVYNMLA